jgi:transposase
MAGHPLLPNPSCLVLESIGVQNGAIALAARTATAGATCPCCGWLSERVHSHYPRTLLDLPWQGNAVHVVLSVRKFFCDNPDCERRVFAERLPAVAARYARKTCRLADALRELAYLAGGEAAARIARTFGLLVSPDALLESLRRSSLPAPASPTPRVLGVDDFAFKRGRRYGTLLVDLERRCPVDLLLDRESTTVERWLKEHPGVEIVSRDRANCYAEGVRAGAPHAVQVADRWHLIKNVGDALEKVLIRKHSLLREVAARSGDAPQLQPAPPSPRRVRQSQQANARHERRLARYEQILDLHRKGVSILGIQRLTGADPKTIRKYLRNGGLPER